MTKKAKYFFYTTFFLCSFIVVEVVYLKTTKSLTTQTINNKKEFVSIVLLPDLAISTEATYIRHRSLADMFSLFKDDGDLLGYFPSTFSYNHSTLINNTPSRITSEQKN